MTLKLIGLIIGGATGAAIYLSSDNRSFLTKVSDNVIKKHGFSDTISEYISKEGDEGKSICKIMMTGGQGEKMEDISQEECPKLVNSLWKTKEEQPKHWLRISQDKVDDILYQYGLSSEEFFWVGSKWNWEVKEKGLFCNKKNGKTEENQGKIIVSCDVKNK